MASVGLQDKKVSSTKKMVNGIFFPGKKLQNFSTVAILGPFRLRQIRKTRRQAFLALLRGIEGAQPFDTGSVVYQLVELTGALNWHGAGQKWLALEYPATL